MIDFNKIDLNRLYYFYFVATCKNITQAAFETNIHQSGMTRHMQALEKEIGTQLLNRHSEGITLTRTGEEVFRYAERIAREVGAIRKQLDEKDKISGKIRICTTYAIANYILGTYLFEFNKKYPDIHLDIFCDDYEIDIIKNDVDVVIRPYDSETLDIIQESLFIMQGKLYANKEYIQKYGFPENAHDLSKHKFISYSRALYLPKYAPKEWFLNLEGHTSEKNCIMRVNSVDMMVKAAKENFGIILGYENMDIIKSSDLINVAPNLKGTELKMYFSYPKHHDNLLKIKFLRDFLKEKLSY